MILKTLDSGLLQFKFLFLWYDCKTIQVGRLVPDGQESHYMRQESLKKASGVHESSRKPTKKVCDENERKKKNDCRVKNFVVTGRHL